MSRMLIDHHGGDASLRVAEGDCIVTARIVYRALAIREVNSRKWPDRWAVEVEKVTDRKGWDGTGFGVGSQVHFVGTYAKGEQPRDRLCDEPGCEGCA